MDKTIVVNVYRDNYDVYIGRAGKGQNGTFGNPFNKGTRLENITAFHKYFYERLENDLIFKKQVQALKGRRLGCFCKPQPCHGDIIAEYLNKLPELVPLNYAVIGSRSFNNYDFLEQMLNWYTIKTIISGGAKGTDSLAKLYGNRHNIPVKEFYPNWDLYGKTAGFKRNELIVNACDEVVAFWDGKSKGTQHSIKLAEKTNKPVHIYSIECIDDIANLGL